ncbi:MAG: hypothetical protein ABI947_14735 [Chloroflexota bacterium]
MTNPELYPYIQAQDPQGKILSRPLMPLKLENDTQSMVLNGLLDTGATINVLPYEIGLALGLVWSQQNRSVELTGNLAQFEARASILIGVIGQFQPIPLVFAWTRAEGIPLLLGQVNFFAEFDVCFFHARGIFEIQPKVELSS